jgi:hypothetical protein
MNDVLKEWVAKAEGDYTTASRELAASYGSIEVLSPTSDVGSMREKVSPECPVAAAVQVA